MVRCRFVPPYLLARIAPESIVVDDALRAGRTVPYPDRTTLLPTAAAWTVHTADNTTTLPGRAVRSAGDPESGDVAVDEAAAGITGALALFDEVYGRRSYDGKGAPVSLTVHYGRDYDNAFWDGVQLVFGDGDGRVFARFTADVGVLGHELTHAVTEHSAGLRYQDQSGALNESVSDVFAACLEQRLLGQTVADASWLIGAGIFLPGVDARALRDMAAPGTAYDDPVLGKDPQVGHFDDYVETTDDNGGVHLNSGIPNRAFQLAAVAIGGATWEGAGRIWYDALTGGRVGPDTGFAGFAAATIAAAGAHADAVGSAWDAVGVTPDAEPTTTAPPAGTASRRVAVRRTGGFAGLHLGGEVDLDGDDPRGPEVAALIERVDLHAVTDGPHQPDRFLYAFDLCGDRATVPEQHLSPDLRRLADLVLEQPRTDPRGADWR
ncbi:M4 family peptidase [Nocardioides sp. MAH-18]|uniref:Neutral metalloproteinase n=1 Tax=Nocardioides agri TaxID=2682843 RepID=A0A6L6XQ20_9ACTN|nr:MULTISPECIES: protealysin inhibitor emfourin [unclassified Nocardioides]MBA2954508.1 M4 family metallopeptidase [Nocardioides sp. CGMCC 1.13656]MVQ49369.1 M4 family peptidase [Nocardioides sp. MAH-18]